MFYFLFRLIGMFLLAIAVVLAVLDITRSITASAIIMTPLAQAWADTSPTTLLSVRQFIETTLHPLLWDPAALFILKLPSWLVFWFVAMVLLWMGQRRENPYGRFASR